MAPVPRQMVSGGEAVSFVLLKPTSCQSDTSEKLFKLTKDSLRGEAAEFRFSQLTADVVQIRMQLTQVLRDTL